MTIKNIYLMTNYLFKIFTICDICASYYWLVIVPIVRCFRVKNDVLFDVIGLHLRALYI